jgi:alpha-N-arabinofuranosidase
MVETPGGEWWAFFLGCRPYEPHEQNHYNTGRETFLAPVRWVDGWPIINPEFDEVQYSYITPDIPAHTQKDTILNGNFTLREEFTSGTLAPYWMFLRTPREKWYSLSEKKGSLRIYLRPARITKRENPSFIGRRQQHSYCTVETALVFAPQADNETAGVVAFQNEHHFYYMGITLSEGKEVICLETGNAHTQIPGKKKRDKHSIIIKEADLGMRDKKNPVRLKITAQGKYISFYYSIDGINWNICEENCDNTLLSTKSSKGFVGSMFGIYAHSQGVRGGNNYADFEWFEYQGFDPVYSEK